MPGSLVRMREYQAPVIAHRRVPAMPLSAGGARAGGGACRHTPGSGTWPSRTDAGFPGAALTGGGDHTPRVHKLGLPEARPRFRRALECLGAPCALTRRPTGALPEQPIRLAGAAVARCWPPVPDCALGDSPSLLGGVGPVPVGMYALPQTMRTSKNLTAPTRTRVWTLQIWGPPRPHRRTHGR